MQTAVSTQRKHDQCCMADLIPNGSFQFCQLPVLAMTDNVVGFMQNTSLPHANQGPDLTACQQTAFLTLSECKIWLTAVKAVSTKSF